MTTWTAKTLPPELADTAQWRAVDVDALSDDDRSRFLKYQAAIETYLRTGGAKAVLSEHGIFRSELLRQLNRCVSPAADGRLYGWAALITGFRTNSYQRRAELPVGCKTSGSVGSFLIFLARYPEIKNKIDTLILKRAEKDMVHEARIALKNIHAAFISCCEQVGLTGNDYPLNSKSKGRRSIERYAHDLLSNHAEQAVHAKFGAVAHSHLKVGRGRTSAAIAYAPYDVVGIDPHKLDCIGTVRILGPKGPQRVAIERLWIVPVLDEYSRAILGYSVGIRTECSAATIEQAVISAMSCWRPRELKVPKMIYATGAGLPSGAFSELVGRGWAAMMVDNAAVHYSQAIAERVRRRIGCAINYGPIGHWEHRPALERVMRTLEIYGFQRLPSTTGRSPLDPAKDDPVRKAIELGIDWEVLLDLIDVIIANYNATSNEALGNRSPLSLLGDYVSSGQLSFLPRRLPQPIAALADLGVTIETRVVRGNLSQGRRPYIEIDRVHYTSPLLSSTFGLIGKKMRLHIRQENMCSVVAYHESGEELGILTAQGTWGRTKHTREMRKQINELRDNGELVIGYHDDPIVTLLKYLGSKTHRDVEKKPMKISRNATELVRTATDSDLPLAPLEVTAPTTVTKSVQGVVSPPNSRPLSVLVTPPQWKTFVH